MNGAYRCELDGVAAGLAAHRAGRLVEAELIYRRVLDAAPDQAVAAYLLGLLLIGLRRGVEAELLLRHALALHPEDMDTRRALAQACALAGGRCEAIDLYHMVLQARPDDLTAQLNLATLLREDGALEAAEAACGRALAVRPEAFEALEALGGIRLARGDATGAAAAYRAALSRQPSLAAAHVGLAMALLTAGQAREALASARTASVLAPRSALAWFAAGTASRRLGRPLDAVEQLKRAVRLDPRHVAAWVNLGHAHADLDQAAEAERCLRAALSQDPDAVEALCSLGVVLTETGRLEEAIGCFDRALTLQRDRAETHWHRAIARLLAGDLAAGWGDFEWRKRHPGFRADFPTDGADAWDGGDLAGRRILVRAEQGFGDTIQFARFLPLLAGMGAQVFIACPPTLRTLLSQLPVEMVGDAAPPPVDCVADLLSLPFLLGPRAAEIPAPAGYLRAAPADGVRARAGGIVRVGLVWCGNPSHRNDARRSLPSRAVAAVVAAGEAAPRLRFESLQCGARAAEAGMLYGIRDRSAQLDDFAATAAVIEQLDLVVTVDTAVAHLAGAMGKPVWVMLPFAPDWRWMLGRDTSPWYASMRLFRQTTPGDWTGVTARVAAALIAAYGDGASREVASREVASAPSAAAAPVTTAPQTMSATVTSVDQPCSVARLVMS